MASVNGEDVVKGADNISSRSESKPDLLEDTYNPSRRKKRGDDQDNSEWKGQYKAMNTDMLERKLIQATKYKDKKMLEQSIKAYNDSGQSTKENEVYEEASKILDILNTKESLIEATKKKDINDIRLILSSIIENDKELKKKYKEQKKKWTKEHSYEDCLLFEMSEARKVCRVVESGRGKNRKSVPTSLKLDRNTMSEIKRYKKPPEGLHEIMQATLLLLGTDEELTEGWSCCAKMSNPDGRQGLNKRLQNFEVTKLHPEICARARDILDGLEYNKILKASAGGATFYIWCMGTIDEFEQIQSLDDVEAATIEKQIQLFRPEDVENKDDHPMFMPRTNKRKGAKAVINSHAQEHFQNNLRAPHSAGTAEQALSKPRQYTKTQHY